MDFDICLCADHIRQLTSGVSPAVLLGALVLGLLVLRAGWLGLSRSWR